MNSFVTLIVAAYSGVALATTTRTLNLQTVSYGSDVSIPTGQVDEYTDLFKFDAGKIYMDGDMTVKARPGANMYAYAYYMTGASMDIEGSGALSMVNQNRIQMDEHSKWSMSSSGDMEFYTTDQNSIKGEFSLFAQGVGDFNIGNWYNSGKTHITARGAESLLYMQDLTNTGTFRFECQLDCSFTPQSQIMNTGAMVIKAFNTPMTRFEPKQYIVFSNNGVICLENSWFKQTLDMTGNGCWVLSKGSVMQLFRYNSFAYSTAIFLEDMDTYVQLFNVGAGDNLEVKLLGIRTGMRPIRAWYKLSSVEYNSVTGYLKVWQGTAQMNFNIGTGYDALGFSIDNYDVVYAGKTPEFTRPDICGCPEPDSTSTISTTLTITSTLSTSTTSTTETSSSTTETSSSETAESSSSETTESSSSETFSSSAESSSESSSEIVSSSSAPQPQTSTITTTDSRGITTTLTVTSCIEDVCTETITSCIETICYETITSTETCTTDKCITTWTVTTNGTCETKSGEIRSTTDAQGSDITTVVVIETTTTCEDETTSVAPAVAPTAAPQAGTTSGAPVPGKAPTNGNSTSISTYVDGASMKELSVGLIIGFIALIAL